MRKTTALLLGLAAGTALLFGLERRRGIMRAQEWLRARPGTALITGASSGIGAAFARALAREGYNLVILARREDRLKKLAEEIQADIPVQIEILVADLDKSEDLEKTARQIEAIGDLDLLVNNAGFGTSGPYAELDPQEMLRMVRVHIIASTRLARAALPGMLTRRRGGIINVSSMASFLPFSGNSIYGGTKAYLNFLSESLQMELQGSGVRIQSLCPGFTYTEIHKKSGPADLPAFMWMQPEFVVKESLKGLQEDRLYVIPGAVYKLGAQLTNNPLLAPFTRRLRDLALRWRGVGPG